jgi:CRP/FNR family transcriptional regulator, cyclic AMP receptor protein
MLMNYLKSQIEKAFFLKKLKLFAELDLEILLSIAEKLHEDDYDKSETIFSRGQVANRIYFIAKGEVEIEGKRLKELDYFGDESLFNDRPRDYAAIARTDALLLTLSRSHLLSIISECPSVAIALLQAYSQQLSSRHT